MPSYQIRSTASFLLLIIIIGQGGSGRNLTPKGRRTRGLRCSFFFPFLSFAFALNPPASGERVYLSSTWNVTRANRDSGCQKLGPFFLVGTPTVSHQHGREHPNSLQII
ncbi:hypothetical protein BDD12DRAFT_421 [Trichophaea hybrida]|nr:hypothetical protein BDD12DRAFT_421 [Trichophaea hybrida]